MTVAEAAAIFKLPPSTIYAWVREGRLPCYRLGPRAILFTRELLDEFAATTLDAGRRW